MKRPSDCRFFKIVTQQLNEDKRPINKDKIEVLAAATDLLERTVHQTNGGTQPRLSIQEKLGTAYMDATSPSFSISGDDLKILSEVLQEASLFSFDEEDGVCNVSINIPNVMAE